MPRPGPRLSLLLFHLSACDPSKPAGEEDSAGSGSDSTGASSTWYPDDDGDGFGASYGDPVSSADQPHGTVANAEDCNDDDPDIHPGSVELCNRKDDDCDGEIDEDPDVAGTFYVDTDGDGYGDPDAASVRSCEAPEGYSSSHDDCDDSVASIHPDAVEDCTNGVDDDCDGEVDEDEAGTLLYRDSDSDGWGDETQTVRACDGTAGGYVAVAGDCDDSTGGVSPSASEYCDGVDNDCDGIVDTDGESQWFRDLDGDGFGGDAFTVDGCDAPADGVALPGDCDEADSAISPAATEICENDVDEDCDTVDSSCDSWGPHGLGEADAAMYCGPDDGQAGLAVASGGDQDGDGMTEILVGATKGGTDDAGAVYVVRAPGIVSGDLPDISTATIAGRSANSRAGISMSSAGDLDADGFPEVWIGSLYDLNEAGESAGSASLVFGPLEGSVSLLDADVRWMGEEGGDVASRVASGGDLDGDDLADLVVGAWFDSTTARASGAAYVLLGEPPTGDRSLEAADIKLLGTSEESQLGAQVALIGDTDADGQPEVAVNDIKFESAGLSTGAVFVLLEIPAAGVYMASEVAEVIPGDSDGMGLGGGITSMGDINDDGYDDFAVGATDDSEGAPYAGAIFVVEGPVTSVRSISDAVAKWTGTVAKESTSPAAGGNDLDGDGEPDLAVGGWYGESDYPGAVYVLRGPFEEGTHSLEDADATFMGESIADEAGRALALLADADGDGRSDLLIGAPGVADSCGAAYLVLGTAR